MDTIVQDPEVHELVKKISLRYLLNTYFFFKPSVSQTEMGKRFNVGQMTVSRMLTKEYEIKDEWIPVVFDMMCELSRLGIREYAGQLSVLASKCEKAIIFSEYEDISSITYEQILLKESEDFERIDISLYGFKYFSWDRKITWAFVRAQDIRKKFFHAHDLRGESLESYLERYFPKRTDRVTLYVTDKATYEIVLRWYSQMNWKDSVTDYLRDQKHAVMWIDLEQKSVAKYEELTPDNK